MPFYVIIISLISHIALASPYSKQSGRFHFDWTLSYLNSTENLDGSGNIVDLPNGGEFTEILNHFSGNYDYSKRLTLTSGADLNRVTSNDGNFERTLTNLTNLYFGFEYTMYRGRFWLMPSLNLKIPIETYDTSTDEALANNPSYDLTALLNFSTKWKSLYVHAYGGVTYRTEGLSMLLPFGIESLYKTRRWRFGGGLKSHFSLIDDDDTSNKTARNNFLNQVNAGSFRYYSINPSQTSIYAFLRYFIKPDFYLGSGVEQTLLGENSYYGTSIIGQIGFYFGSKKRRGLPRLKPKRFKRDTKKNFQYKFEEEKDQDEDVFQKGRPIRYKKENVDKELNDIESEIEIKLKNR